MLVLFLPLYQVELYEAAGVSFGIKNRRHLMFVDFPWGHDCAVEIYGDGRKDQHEELVQQT